MSLTISFIITKNFSWIRPALHSLYQTTQTPCRVIIIINSGTQEKIDALSAEFPKVEIVINDSLKGFAANHNQVMRMATSDFVALLNDDIILHDIALDTLVNFLRNHPDVALVGPQLEYADGSSQVSAYSDPSLFRSIYKISGLGAVTHQQSLVRKLLLRLGIGKLMGVESLNTEAKTREVPVIKGVAMVVRRAAYELVGMMDETTLIYGEEFDWHLRLRRAGWKIMLVAEARVTHFGLGGATLKFNTRTLVEDRKSTLKYYLTYRPRWQGWIIRLAIIFSHVPYSLLWLPFSRQKSQAHYRTAKIGLTWQLR